MDYALIRVADRADWQVYHTIRRSSLWEEGGFSGYDEDCPLERLPHYHPLLLKLGPRGIGTARLDDLRDGRGVVWLVAVTAALRGPGHGRGRDAQVAG